MAATMLAVFAQQHGLQAAKDYKLDTIKHEGMRNALLEVQKALPLGEEVSLSSTVKKP